MSMFLLNKVFPPIYQTWPSLLCANNWHLLKEWVSLILSVTADITRLNPRLSAGPVLCWDQYWWIHPFFIYSFTLIKAFCTILSQHEKKRFILLFLSDCFYRFCWFVLIILMRRKDTDFREQIFGLRNGAVLSSV